MSQMVSQEVRVALVGLHGHGAVHLANVRRLQDLHRCRLVAVADPRPPEPAAVGPDVPVFGDLPALLAAVGVDVVVLCTPIHTHATLARAALRAGADVLLEKPPVPTMAEFEHLQRVCAQTGRVCQVGFQSLSSAAVAALRRAVSTGALGEIRSIGAEGAWIRPVSYFTRSRWVGHRELDGVPVMDGALTNPFAHAVVTALHVDGSELARDVLSVEPDLFHANDIHTDDTSVVRIRTRRGRTVTIGATLCPPQDTEPTVTVRGSRATAVLSYLQDTISIEAGPGQGDPPADLAGRYDRVDLLANLIDHRTDPSIPLLVDLPVTGSFTAVLDAIRRAPEPTPIPADCVTWVGTGDDRHPVVADVRRWIRLAVDRGRTFTELGAPWTARAAAGRDRPLRLGANDIGGQRTGLDVVERHSPRPYLHPLRTLDGLVLTDAAPADHPWHLGLGIAVPDVNGSNLWGGPTYRRDTGYRWRVDHGRIDLIDSRDRATSLDQRLHWVDVSGSTVLAERRNLTWWLPAAPGAWVLDLSTTLESSGDVQLGSPATHGRAGAGYGGLFWRLPAVDDIDVRTASAAGEQDVHGRVDPWLAVGLRVGERRASVLIVADPDAHDPWFVRVSDYAGVGAAWAWERTAVVGPARPLRRHYRFVVADGIRDPQELAAIVAVRRPTAE